MTSDIWYGGGQSTPIRCTRRPRAEADIVGVEEPEGNLRRLARLGSAYVDDSLDLISRFRSSRWSAARRFAYAALGLDQVVAVGNVHLNCCPYGPEEAASARAHGALALAPSLRLPIRAAQRSAGPVSRRRTPTFLTGDFNSPFHLDWTEPVHLARPERVPFALEWLVSRRSRGPRRSPSRGASGPGREPRLHLDAGTPPPRIRRKETLNRIDWAMAAGRARRYASRLVGDQGGGTSTRSTPTDRPPRRRVHVRGHPRRAPRSWSAEPRVVTRGERSASAIRALAEPRAGDPAVMRGGRPLMSIPIYDASDHLASYFGTRTLRPGAYRAALLNGDGSVEASYRFWIEAPGTRPSIGATRASYVRGEPIGLRFGGAPANKLDWIGIYRAGDDDLYNYFGFKYTGARPSGRLSFTKADLGTLDPGRYRATLMLDDGYSVLAETRFRVR